MTIEEGKLAPTFTLTDQDGNKVALKDFRGKTVVVYFYPKDDTPGCTKQACSFRENIKAYEKLNTIILGVSPDTAESHTRFIEKFKLPFTLLSDPSKKVMEKYGAWGEKVLYGRKSVGVIRSTTIIGPDGKVIKHWKKVPNAAAHPDKVLQILSDLS